MINHRSEEEYIISDWVESLDDKYHNLFPNVGEKLQITYHHRNGIKCTKKSGINIEEHLTEYLKN